MSHVKLWLNETTGAVVKLQMQGLLLWRVDYWEPSGPVHHHMDTSEMWATRIAEAWATAFDAHRYPTFTATGTAEAGATTVPSPEASCVTIPE